MNTLKRRMFQNGDEARVTETDFYGMPIISTNPTEDAVPFDKYLGMNTGMYSAPPSNNEDVIQEYLKNKELDNIARREEILASQDPDKAVNPTELIKYYVSQDYKPNVIIELLQKQFPTITQSDVLDTIISYRQSQDIQKGGIAELNAFDSMLGEDFTDVKGLDRNQIQFRNGEIIDFDVGLASIKNGTARTEEIYALYNTPGVKLGADVAREIESFLEKRPGISKLTGSDDDSGAEKFRTGIGSVDKINIPISGQSLARTSLGIAGDATREGLEKGADFFIGQDAGDRFRGDYLGGDPDAYFRSGGRDQASTEDMARGMNDPDRSSTGLGFIANYASDKISDLLSNINLPKANPDPVLNLLKETLLNARTELGLDPTIQTELDAVNAIPNATDANATAISSFDSSNESIAGGGGQKGRDAVNQKVSVIEVPVDDKEQSEDVTGEEVAEEITSEDAPKRNFAQFTRSPDFLRFVRNIGKGLTSTGQLGQGIALGAAGAAEEKYAEEVALRSAQAAAAAKTGDLTEKMFMEQFKSKEEFLNKQNEYSTSLSKTIFEVETSDAVLGALAEAERLVRTGDVTGLSPLFQEYFNKALRQFGQDVPLSAREAAKNILEDIKNGEIKAILGESGRTISNLDRQIAGNLIGEINFKADKETVLDKIKLARRRANDRFTSAQSNYDAALQPYTRFGVKAPFRIGTPMVQSVDDSGERVRLYIK